MAGCVEGIRRALVLGPVPIAGTAIDQAPSVGPCSLYSLSLSLSVSLSLFVQKHFSL